MQIVFDRWGFNRKKIEHIVNKAAEATFCYKNIDKYDLTVLITNNARIKKINAEFRNINEATDVLSFPSTDACDGGEDLFFGDIAVSVKKAKTQARKYHQSFEKELRFLIIHGCLHLLGYDHTEKKDEELIRQAQRKIISNIQEKN